MAAFYSRLRLTVTKFLLNRKKYDVTYQEELEEAGQSEVADCEEIPFPAGETADAEASVVEA